MGSRAGPAGRDAAGTVPSLPSSPLHRCGHRVGRRAGSCDTSHTGSGLLTARRHRMARTHLVQSLGRIAVERKPLVASLALFAFTAFGLTGCVSQEKFNAQKIAADQYREKLAATESQLSASSAQNDI